MSDNGNTNSGGNQAEAFAQMWTEFASRMAQVGLNIQPSQAPPEAARQMRDALLSAMNTAAQEQLRNPEFLASMKQWMSQSIEMRKQMNDWLGRAQHEFQGASRQDVDQLLAGLHHIEQRTVDGLERLTERIEAIDNRLASLEDAKPAAAKSKKTRTKKTRSTKKNATRSKAAKSRAKR